jgi:hypothetical protein
VVTPVVVVVTPAVVVVTGAAVVVVTGTVVVFAAAVVVVVVAADVGVVVTGAVDTVVVLTGAAVLVVVETSVVVVVVDVTFTWSAVVVSNPDISGISVVVAAAVVSGSPEASTVVICTHWNPGKLSVSTHSSSELQLFNNGSKHSSIPWIAIDVRLFASTTLSLLVLITWSIVV